MCGDQWEVGVKFKRILIDKLISKHIGSGYDLT